MQGTNWFAITVSECASGFIYMSIIVDKNKCIRAILANKILYMLKVRIFGMYRNMYILMYINMFL